MVEQLSEHGYRATALVPMPLVAEAPTREEVVDKIRTLISARLARTELIHVEVPVASDPNPWLAIAGTWRDHPDVDEVVENIHGYRREIDAAPNRL